MVAKTVMIVTFLGLVLPSIAVPTLAVELDTVKRPSAVASTYLDKVNQLKTANTIDVAPEESNPLSSTAVSSWTTGDTAQRCMEASSFKSRLSGAFLTIAGCFQGNRRQARSYLRYIYSMAKPFNIQGISAKCFSDESYDEIVGLIVSFASTATYAKPSISAAGLRQVAEPGPSAAQLLARTVENIAEKITSLSNTLSRDTCPYWNTYCCAAYFTPAIPDEQSYVNCCRDLIEPSINQSWAEGYLYLQAGALNISNSVDYTIWYCKRSSI